MNVTCPSCGHPVDHASPGCAEHARREAENIHVAHLASDTGAEHCPVCTAPAAANRAERRQGMGAENDRLRAAHEEAIETLGEVARDLARAQDEIKVARATIEAQANDIATLRARAEAAEKQHDALRAAVWDHLDAERAESVAYLASINTTGDSLPSEVDAASDRLLELRRRAEAALAALVARAGGAR